MFLQPRMYASAEELVYSVNYKLAKDEMLKNLFFSLTFYLTDMRRK